MDKLHGMNMQIGQSHDIILSQISYKQQMAWDYAMWLVQMSSNT